MSNEPHDYVSIKEFARRVGVGREAVQYAIKRGRINLTGQTQGSAKLIDWTTESPKWQSNRTRSTETYRQNAKGKGKGKSVKKKQDFNKIEKHIGDSTVYETGQMGIDPSVSRFDDIPDIDGIQAPEGSVAYFQAKKLAVDALRNLNKLKLETAQLISVSDAITLFCGVLTQIADSVQTIPAKLSNVVVANIRKSVESWRIQPENLESEIFKLLTLQCKEILNEISKRIADAPQDTKDFIDDNITAKK